MHSETCEQPTKANSPDLINLDSPTDFFHQSRETLRSVSPESDVTNTLRKEYNGFLKSTTIIANQTQDIFQASNLGRSSSNQSNLSCETVRMKDRHNDSFMPPTEENREPTEEVQKLVSFVSENDGYSDRVFASPANFKNKRETDGESSDLSFGCPSLEKFRMTEDHSFIQSSIIDQDLERVEGLLEGWTSDLKKKILGEFSQSKIRLLEYYRQQIYVVKEKHNAEMSRLREDNDSCRDRMRNLEESLRAKDDRISELSGAVKSYENKSKLQKYFSDWKIKQNEAEKERITDSLALRHYRRTLARKTWRTWCAAAESSSRSRREKACQVEDQEFVVEGLRKDYEERLASMKESLEQSKREIERLNRLKESVFEVPAMRGSTAREEYAPESSFAFRDRNDRFTRSDEARDIYVGSFDFSTDSPGHHSHHNLQTLYSSHQEEPTYFSDPSPPVKKVVASHKKPSTSIHYPVNVKPSNPKQVKVVPTKRTKVMVTNLMGTSLAPPLASVVVERHHPINKETIGQAFASKYPVEIVSSRSNATFKKRSSQLIRVLN